MEDAYSDVGCGLRTCLIVPVLCIRVTTAGGAADECR